jgi:hypothetical protein
MARLVIDINAKHVPEDRRIWRMFPGDRYRFLNSFLKNGVAFLELPGLELPEGAIEAETPELRERLHVSREVESWIQAYRKYARSAMTEEPPKQPDRTPTLYAGQALNRNQRQNLGAVRNLFGIAEKGDLLVVPDQIPTRTVMIGEFLHGPDSRIRHSEAEHFLGEATPARQVRWFPAVDELRVPRELSSILRIPPAISQVPRSFEGSILENSYGTFYRPGQFSARITIGGTDFDTQNTSTSVP